ncbi:hypothetical protein BGX21_009525 [Mortierella sp. AD011]|nr:hypothetical protein BGX20_009464 [Mortierella sp. AD010]KAF9396451.1 hypothetical protein BGX21_009525 [Mortierella sp. AD011]
MLGSHASVSNRNHQFNQQTQFNQQEEQQDAMAALKAAVSASFFTASNHTTDDSTNMKRTRVLSSNVSATEIKSLSPPPPPANNTHSSALPSRMDENNHSNSHGHVSQHRLSELPTPPLTSTHPPSTSAIFPGLSSRPSSTVLDRCEALESEVSELRSKLHHSEQSSTLREKRLSQVQQQSSNTQQSLQTLKHQYEMTLIQLSKIQTEATSSRARLEEKEKENQQLKSQVHKLASELREANLDRDSLSLEMAECHSDNAKFLKRLRTSNDKVDGLQDENRYLIEQLRELRAKVTDISGKKSRLSESLDRERHRAGQAALELEGVVARYKGEVERLQDLVLALGHKQVQVQSQLAYFQQQHQQQQAQDQRLPANFTDSHIDGQDQSSNGNNTLSTCPNVPSTATDASMSLKAAASSSSTTAMDSSPQQQRYGDLALGDGALASILSSVAASSNSRRSKPARRFTINASHQEAEAPLTLEQRKSKLLMDQITVLQRGYDTLREEKATLELQLEMMQRQHLYHQHRHNRRNSQRKALGPDQHQQQPSQGQDSQTGNNTLPSATDDVSVNDRKAVETKQDRDFKIQETLASLESKTGQRGGREAQITSPRHFQHVENDIEASGDFAPTSPLSPVASLGSLSSSASLASDKLSQRLYTQKMLHPSRQHQHQHGSISRVISHHNWDVQQCSCCMGVLIEI